MAVDTGETQKLSPEAVHTKTRILLTDDDKRTRDMFARIAKHTLPGFSMETAANPEEASQKLEEGQFDILLTDLNMQRHFDGIQLAQETTEKHPKVKVIIMSFLSQEDLPEKVKIPDGVEYIEKDINSVTESLMSTSQTQTA